jgi:hypothetical protein
VLTAHRAGRLVKDLPAIGSMCLLTPHLSLPMRHPFMLLTVLSSADDCQRSS